MCTFYIIPTGDRWWILKGHRRPLHYIHRLPVTRDTCSLRIHAASTSSYALQMAHDGCSPLSPSGLLLVAIAGDMAVTHVRTYHWHIRSPQVTSDLTGRSCWPMVGCGSKTQQCHSTHGLSISRIRCFFCVWDGVFNVFIKPLLVPSWLKP